MQLAYWLQEKATISMWREAKLKGGFYVEAEAKLFFIVHNRGWVICTCFWTLIICTFFLTCIYVIFDCMFSINVIHPKTRVDHASSPIDTNLKPKLKFFMLYLFVHLNCLLICLWYWFINLRFYFFNPCHNVVFVIHLIYLSVLLNLENCLYVYGMYNVNHLVIYTIFNIRSLYSDWKHDMRS